MQKELLGKTSSDLISEMDDFRSGFKADKENAPKEGAAKTAYEYKELIGKLQPLFAKADSYMIKDFPLNKSKASQSGSDLTDNIVLSSGNFVLDTDNFGATADKKTVTVKGESKEVHFV